MLCIPDEPGYWEILLLLFQQYFILPQLIHGNKQIAVFKTGRNHFNRKNAKKLPKHTSSFCPISLPKQATFNNNKLDLATCNYLFVFAYILSENNTTVSTNKNNHCSSRNALIWNAPASHNMIFYSPRL